ncbi:response regulator transcription factor [Marinisporobacter balticus]|uniref:Stage 0 sporulation protein A homolog n=1 Tax=Marinisporobacter balticus TaxID=2018667 RepID=A0A4R2KCX8_9FIRM|nr:response regulator transcription factor [Marinisporobacter balticus]TCO67738.1 two-component system response regulator CssR [Marinisporobacter balticus]
MKQIFLVEDEKPLRNLLVSYLADAKYYVKTFHNGLDAKKPDLWILDIMLPGMDGYALIKQIKSNTPEIPVVFMSARSAELDRVIGLEMGSDDYLPKPFLPRELVLRVNRLLNIKKKQGEVIVPLGPYTFHRQKRIISNSHEEIVLTVKEYDILEFLIDNRGNAISRTNIIDAVWGTNYFGSERVIDDTLRRLRKKVPHLLSILKLK